MKRHLVIAIASIALSFGLASCGSTQQSTAGDGAMDYGDGVNPCGPDNPCADEGENPCQQADADNPCATGSTDDNPCATGSTDDNPCATGSTDDNPCAAGGGSKVAAKGDPKAGAEVYEECSGCHGDLDDPGGFGPDLFAEEWDDEERKEAYEIIKNGKGKMPAWDDKLSEQQIQDVIAFLEANAS